MANEDRILLEIFTIANLAGINAAQKSLLKLNATTIGLAAGLYGLFEVAKAADENWKAQTAATDDLTQAYATQRIELSSVQKQIDDFLRTNAEYIKDQYDTQHAIALFVRAGNDQIQTMRLINDALDLSVARHEGVSAAAETLEGAMAGNARGLRLLGISLKEYNDIMKNETIPLDVRQAELLQLIESRVAHARETTDVATKSENARNNAWRDFTEKIGPAVIFIEEEMNEAAIRGLGVLSVEVDLLTKLAHLNFHDLIHLLTLLANPSQALLEFLGLYVPKGTGGTGTKKRAPLPGAVYGGGLPAYDEGGMVPGRGPQLAVVHGGETVTPPGRGVGRPIQIIIQGGMFMDHGPTIDLLTNKIAQRLRMVSGI